MAQAAERAERWTFRRVPGRVARGLAVASLAAVTLFLGHVGGWGALGRLHLSLIGSGLAVGLPVALAASFFLAAPALRALARQGRFTRRRTVMLGAAFYGGIVFLWQLLVQAGPPETWLGWMREAGAGEGLVTAFALLYRHLLTPAAFALYGALAALAGWAAAFGARAEAPDGLGA